MSSSQSIESLTTFLATNTSILITPFFDNSPLQLIDQTLGPFTAQLSLPVPLYLATYLKQRHMCSISPPSWLEVSFLEKVLRHEKDPLNVQFYTPEPLSNDPNVPADARPLPYYYVELARLVLRWAEDVPDSDLVRTLVADIESVRASKVRESILGLSSKMEAESDIRVVKASGMGSLEVGHCRDVVEASLRQHFKLSGAESSEKGGDTSSASRSGSAGISGVRRSNKFRRRSGADENDNDNNSDSDNDHDNDDDDNTPTKTGGISSSQFSQDSNTQSTTFNSQADDDDDDDDELEEPTMAKTNATLRRFR